MKKIFWILIFLSVVLRADELGANASVNQNIDQNTSAQNVYTLMQQILDDNAKIKDYKLKSEGNESIYAKEISSLQKDKTTLLSSLPNLISQQKLDKKRHFKESLKALGVMILSI